ncbi:MAG: hypothetical protein IJG24_07555, partial [Selenomonadaceae bacterium]|nr:hypothetical protein [Selenomonadaceae bacterium]
MEKALPKNRPTLCESVLVNRLQFDHIFTDAAAAKGDEIAKSLATLKDDIAPAADKTFVMMKNKQVWFDRNNAALFPKFESGVLPVVRMCNHEAHNYSGLDFEGFHFVTMTQDEFNKSFIQGTGCPYLKSDNYYMYLSSNLTWYNWIAVEEIDGNRSLIRCSTNNYSWESSSNYRAQLIPIHRLRGKNAAAMNYHDAFFTWIQLGLVPEGLKPKKERLFQSFID